MKSSEVSQITSFVKHVLLLLLAAVVIRGSLIEAFIIPSASMVPTLRIGDHIFVWKLSYGLRLPGLQKSIVQFSSPDRGDVVVFTREDDPLTRADESDQNIIKRVVGLPGDVVNVEGTKVTVNGTVVEEDYARWEFGGLPEGDFGPETVPEGHLFMLGDNRDRSKDSRFWNGTHYLPIVNVKGRAFMIYWSWKSFGRIGKLIY